jgi:hypothetical protein
MSVNLLLRQLLVLPIVTTRARVAKADGSVVELVQRNCGPPRCADGCSHPRGVGIPGPGQLLRDPYQVTAR